MQAAHIQVKSREVVFTECGPTAKSQLAVIPFHGT